MSEPRIPVFDYHGALTLARRLARLADTWERSFDERAIAYGEALASWTGPHRDHVARRFAHERSVSESACRALRAEADRWARAWTDAVDDANRARWSAATIGVVESTIPIPPPVDVPVAPHYQPTAPVPGVER